MEEYDAIILYVIPSHSEDVGSVPVTDEMYRREYNRLVEEHEGIEKELSTLLDEDPSLSSLADALEKELMESKWEEKRFQKPIPQTVTKVEPVAYDDWEMYDY